MRIKLKKFAQLALLAGVPEPGKMNLKDLKDDSNEEEEEDDDEDLDDEDDEDDDIQEVYLRFSFFIPSLYFLNQWELSFSLLICFYA